MAEEEVEAEEELVTPEAPSNPRIGVEAEATRRSTANGMPHSLLALVEGDQFKLRLRGHGGKLTIVEAAIIPPKKGLRIETPRIFPPTTLKNLMTGREPEVPAPERIDTEEKEAMKDMTPGETIMMRAEIPTGIMGPALVGGNIVRPEETKTMTDIAEEIRAQGIGLAQDLDTRGKTRQMKVGDTLVTTGDGDAKGPWVMKGPL